MTPAEPAKRVPILPLTIPLIVAVIGAIAVLLPKAFLEGPTIKLGDLHSKQEDLLGQMRGSKAASADDLAGFRATANDLEKWASKYPDDGKSKVNLGEIDRSYSRMWREASQRVENKLRGETNPEARKVLKENGDALLRPSLVPASPEIGKIPQDLNNALIAPPQPPPIKPGPVRLPMHDVKVVLYNGFREPRLVVDGRPTMAAYASGSANFRLAAGTHQIRAEYSDQICEATVTVPAPEPIGATCNLK